MELKDPVAVFTAANNVRAQVLCHMLVQSGIEAYVLEDISGVGLSAFGTVAGIHSPKIYVERADADRAAALIQEQERVEAARLAEAPRDEAGIPTRCEDCDTVTMFPANQRGTVQDCPKCGAYLDVGDEGEDEPGEWADESITDEPPEDR